MTRHLSYSVFFLLDGHFELEDLRSDVVVLVDSVTGLSLFSLTCVTFTTLPLLFFVLFLGPFSSLLHMLR